MRLFHLGLCVNEWPHDGMRRGLEANCTEYRELNCGKPDVNQIAMEICNQFRPDVVFMQVQSPGVIDFNTVQAMKYTGAMVINWTGDVRDEVPTWMRELQASVTAFSNMRDVRDMPGAEYLEIGYDQEIFKPVGEAIAVRPVVFFGNHYGHFPMSQFRLDMVTALRQRQDFGVYGNMPGAHGNFNSSQLDESAAYRGAKLAINVSHYEIEKYSSDRILRIMGSGCFCLAKAYPGMPFIDGVHLRTWSTIPELIQLIDYYLAHQEEREAIAKQGELFVQSEFSYEAMGRAIKEIWNRRK